MTGYKFGDVVLVEFPQSAGHLTKKRPALVILDIGEDDLVLAPITTTERTGKGDLALVDWQDDGLLKTSWLRLAKLACLPKGNVLKLLGQLSNQEQQQVVEAWRLLFDFQV